MPGDFELVSLLMNFCMDCKIRVVDTLSASLGEGMMMQLALDKIAEGKTIEEVADIVREAIPHICVRFTVDNLDDNGKLVGNLNASNTIGSIIGTFVPTFISIPAVGTSITFLIFAIYSALASLEPDLPLEPVNLLKAIP